MQRLDIGPLLDSTIGSLSKGQRKRALLAIGLLMPQPLLLADEPFDGLDLRQSRDVAQTLRSYASAGRTMFLSIHQIKDAARVCDRFVLLSGGTIRGEGTFDAAGRAGRGARRGAPAISKRCSLPSRRRTARPRALLASSSWLARARNTASWWRRAPGGCCCWRWARSSASPSSARCAPTAKPSGLNGTAAGVGEAFSPLIGIWAPTFSACEVAAVFLLPFVAIRLVSGDRQSGALKIEMQHPMPAFARVARQGARAARRLAGRVAGAAGGGRCSGKATAAASIAPELVTVALGHVLNAGLTIALASAAAALTEHPSTAAILTLSVTVGTWILNFVAAVQGGIWERARRLHAAGDGRAVPARPDSPRRRR